MILLYTSDSPPKLGRVALCLSSPPAKLNGTSLPPCGVEDRSAGDQERPSICWPSKTSWMRTKLVSAESLLRHLQPSGWLLWLPLGMCAPACWVDGGSAESAGCFSFGGQAAVQLQQGPSLSLTLREPGVGSSSAAAANFWLQPVVVQRGHCNPMCCTVYISTG